MFIKYSIDHLHDIPTKKLHPDLEPPYDGYISDYFNDFYDDEYLQIINFLKAYSKLEGEEALKAINAFRRKKTPTGIYAGLFAYHPLLGMHYELKRWQDYDPLEIVLQPHTNKLIMFDGMVGRYGFWNCIEDCHKIYEVDIDQWLYLWDWWQTKKEAGLRLETGIVEMLIEAKPKYSLYKPLIKHLKEAITYWSTNPNQDWDYEEVVKGLEKTLRQLIIQTHPEEYGISTLKELSTRRPLLAREKTELDFLEKIQAADSSEALQNLENELNNTATDPQIKNPTTKVHYRKKGILLARTIHTIAALSASIY